MDSRHRNAWAVGATNKNQPVILNWNGKTWRPVSVPGTSGFDPVAVHATSPGDVWVIWGAGVISLTKTSQTYDSLVAVHGPLP